MSYEEHEDFVLFKERVVRTLGLLYMRVTPDAMFVPEITASHDLRSEIETLYYMVGEQTPHGFPDWLQVQAAREKNAL